MVARRPPSRPDGPHGVPGPGPDGIGGRVGAAAGQRADLRGPVGLVIVEDMRRTQGPDACGVRRARGGQHGGPAVGGQLDNQATGDPAPRRYQHGLPGLDV